AFGGETVSDILASVLARDVDFQALPKDLNPRLLDFLRRCLHKNRKHRWHCVADLSAELESITVSPRALPPVEVAALNPRPLWKRAIPVAITAILVTTATVLVESNLKQTIAPEVTRFPVTIPGLQQINVQPLGISPDGSQLIYVADNKLYLHSMSEFDSRPIAGTDAQGYGLAYPVFSPDGHFVVYADLSKTREATLKKVPITGGSPDTLFHGGLPSGITWDSSGIIFAQRNGGVSQIVRLRPNGGTPDVLVTLKSG